jgi:CarboxypepD_reg-like domain/Carboxypeptidase regulatory-like domain
MCVVAVTAPVSGQATGHSSGSVDTAAADLASATATPLLAPVGAIAGLVVDSLRGGPLIGAQISVEGINAQAVTDSTGRFRIDSVPPGNYRVGVFHPLLDSLGVSIASPPLTVAAATTLRVVFSTPSAPTFLRLSCGDVAVDTAAGFGPSVLIGRVLDAETDAPVAGVRVSLNWTDMQVSKSNGLRRTARERDSTTGPSGGFRFCRLPSRLTGVARATRRTGDMGAISRPYAMNGRLVGFLVLHISSTDTTGANASSSYPASRPAGAVLTGRVLRPDGGGPLTGVQVTVAGTQAAAVTGDSGEFTLRELPTGTRMLQVLAVGWEPMSIPVELTQHEARHVVVALKFRTAVLTGVVVTAQLNAGLHRVGFDTRKQLGIGHFLTPDDVAKRTALQFIDLMAEMPGVIRQVNQNGDDYLVGTRGAHGCVSYVIDGVAYQEATPGEINTRMPLSEIGAIEVYQASETPPQYAYSPPAIPPPVPARNRTADIKQAGTIANQSSVGGTTCVKIVIWTKGRLR